MAFPPAHPTEQSFGWESVAGWLVEDKMIPSRNVRGKVRRLAEILESPADESICVIGKRRLFIDHEKEIMNTSQKYIF